MAKVASAPLRGPATSARHRRLKAVVWTAGIGAIAEGLSMTAFAMLQRRLPAPAGGRLTFGSLMAIAYTGTAISLAVPVAGSGLATAYSHRRFRAGGADPAGVSMAMLMAGVISTVAFAVVAGAGAVVSGNPGASCTTASSRSSSGRLCCGWDTATCATAGHRAHRYVGS
jgi:uncharacterized membrane protein YbhN (UPF0104 family)